MQQDTVVLSFPGCSAKDANLHVQTLAESLTYTDPNLTLERRRDRTDTQDFGATLAIILGSAAVSTLARGIANWLARNSGARIDITTEDGQVLASNLNSGDVPRIIEALSGRR
jgi:hypothetical protein